MKMIPRKLRENCGIFGVFGHPKAVDLIYLGLYALQHRGQESAGLVASDGKRARLHRGMGLVAEALTTERLRELKGHLALGHVRYSTTGSSDVANAQPFAVNHARGFIAVAHNGNLVNVTTLKRKLEEEGAIFQTSMDTELIIHLLARSRCKSLEESLVETLSSLRAAYSLGMMNEKQLIAARDPQGWRPLCIGTLEGAYVIASESCATFL